MNLKSLRFLVVPLAAAMSLTPLAAVLAQQLTQTGTETAASEDGTLRPFRVNVPEEALVDLRRRLAATRWPSRETVADQSQGVQLTKLEELVRYWGAEYDWRKAEAKLNTFPQFVTTIDGVDIHFIHVRSRHPNALPLIMTHGWPGSIFELLKTVEPLTDPTAYGGRAGDAFDLVIPSIPGFGFSGKPSGTGWDPDRIARAWTELMKRLGYTRYVAQGGDWGAPISSAMARHAPAGLLGIHLNYPASVPPEIDRAIRNGDPAPAGLSASRRECRVRLAQKLLGEGAGYRVIMGTRPQTLSYGLAAAPVAFAAFMYDYNGGEPQHSLTKDEVLDNVTLYWLTNPQPLPPESTGRTTTGAIRALRCRRQRRSRFPLR